MAISEEVLNERYGYIGSSDAAPVCGIPSAFSTPYGVFVEKVWRLRADSNDAMEIGTLMEPVIAELYRRRMKTEIIEHPTVRHTRRNWQAANLDRVAILTGNRRIVELKNAATSMGWGPAGTDMVPSHYYLQVQHQLDVVSSSHDGIDGDVADMAVLIGGSNFRIYEIQKSPKVIARMSEIEEEFWDRVVKQIAPAPDFTHAKTLDVMKLVYQTVEEKKKKQLTDAEASMIGIINRCHEFQVMERKAKKAVAELKARILHDMQDYSEYSLPNGMAVRRQKVRTKTGGYVKLNIKGGIDDVESDDE